MNIAYYLLLFTSPDQRVNDLRDRFDHMCDFATEPISKRQFPRAASLCCEKGAGVLIRFRSLLPFVLVVPSLSLFAAETNQLDASEALFTVLAAANAAGYDAGLASSPPLRREVREKVLASHAAAIADLQAWYKQHPEPDKTQDLSRFISLGLSVKDPPSFGWSKREVEVPPDAMALNGFREFLPAFYEQAKIGDIWKASQGQIDRTLERYQEPISRAVLEANSYLRNPTYGFLGRRFQVYVDFLGAPNQVQARSFGDDYFLVLTPSNDLRIFDIRHAYFRYLIDPLGIKYGMALKEKESLEDIAQGAPLLKAQYRNSFDLLATECLIKAIESRMLSNPSLVDQAVREGYILAPFFAEQLAIYEKQPDSMKLFFPEMVKTLNVKHEIRRLANVEFASEAPAATHREQPPAPVAEAASTQAGRTLAQADESYDKKDLENARQLYERSLEQPGNAADHSKAYYGLAHIALLQKHPETADQLFRKTLESSPEPEVKAWSCYYLGKLSAVADEREEAVKWFQEVLATKGASPKAIESTKRELAQLAPADNEQTKRGEQK